MSMLSTLSRLTQEQVQAMRADPAVIPELLYDLEPAPPLQPGFFARLLGKKAAPVRVRALPWIGAGQQLDLDHEWQILHYLLTGTIEGGAFPASFICEGGEEVGEDRGYGPPRLFSSQQARAIADHLATLDERDVLRRYRPDDIVAKGVYWQPPATEAEQREDALGLWDTIGKMTRFIDETARHGCALVVEIY